MESTNGVTRQYIGITYILKPRAPGRFTIGSAVAKADGKSLRSNALQLEVTKNSSPNAQAPSKTAVWPAYPLSGIR